MHRQMLAHLLPITDLCKNAMNTLSPPNGVTARGVWRKTTFFSPQSAVISRCTVLFLLRLCLTNFNLTD